VKKNDRYTTLFWMALGIFVASYSYKLGLGKISSPGPGLFPFLLGALFALLSFFKLLAAFLKRDKIEENLQEEGGPVNYTKLCLVGGITFCLWYFLGTAGIYHRYLFSYGHFIPGHRL